MAVSTGGAPADAEEGARDPAGAGPAGRTRRDAARSVFFCALAALVPVATASRWSSPGPAPGGTPDGAAFDETYRGHRIRGLRTPARGAAADARWHVTVDGRPLHLMRRADGTWLSMVDHYQPYRTPLEAARAAVDELGPGRRLRDVAPGPADAGRTHSEDRHGVRA
ncbi:tyrosinase family oxidase copper chaperone [Streptomyces sp. NPDC015220]|uniref:tyrosinase family oxidase copper chaperone n=1 Tax=Streptomyces sp. NPDC015220 TaxID=3364947 RepID=UPI0036FD9659